MKKHIIDDEEDAFIVSFGEKLGTRTRKKQDGHLP